VVRTRAGSKAKQSKQAECRGRVWLAGWLVDLFLRGKEGENMGGVMKLPANGHHIT